MHSCFFVGHKCRAQRFMSGHDRVQRLFQILFSRRATADEAELARRLLARLGKGDAEAAWRDVAHVLLCGNELIYID